MRCSTLVLVLVSLGAARPVAAQSISLVPCWRPMIGVGAGPMVNGDRNGDGSDYEFPRKGPGRQFNASIDVPLGGAWAVRLDGGTVSWAFEQHDAFGNLLLADDVRLKRLTASAVKSVGGCDIPLRFFAGGGLGVYRYEYDDGGAITKGGANGVAGMDVLFGRHVAISAAVSVHFVSGPHREPVFSYLFMAGGLTLGMKFGF